MSEDRALRTTLPDGSVVETSPDPHRPWTISAQCGQADDHRETVRFWLDNRGWRRLPETTRRAA